MLLATSSAMKLHRPRTFAGDAVFFQATAPRDEAWLDPAGWKAHVAGHLDVYELACTHPAMVQPAWLTRIAEVLATRLAHMPGPTIRGSR